MDVKHMLFGSNEGGGFCSRHFSERLSATCVPYDRSGLLKRQALPGRAQLASTRSDEHYSRPDETRRLTRRESTGTITDVNMIKEQSMKVLPDEREQLARTLKGHRFVDTVWEAEAKPPIYTGDAEDVEERFLEMSSKELYMFLMLKRSIAQSFL
ncbi:hypothetical protein M9H77_28378 [Catharanthus roseus]|uniref:Uncharacterized protein n=1 Tax=Catharanthus roseus TaxID=4058 RepID=A0ACC0AH35_CATRO|nr:hypothetical protein M9H77_28378 [Catharanthus roseus]